MKLKRCEKWLLGISLLLFLAAVGLHIARGGEGEVFVLEEGVVFSPAEGVSGQGKININTATVEQLQLLEGIGPALAEKIVAYREANGDFKRIEDIAFVSGIGSEKYEAICDHITVD